MFKLISKITISLFGLFLILGVFWATEVKAQPAAPTLSSPLNGATVNTLTPTLKWNAISGAGAYIWNVLYQDSGVVTSIQANVPSGKLSWGQTYTWRVAACETSEPRNCGNWSSEWSFTTQQPTTPTPTCDSTSYTSCASAFEFSSSVSAKSSMCGSEQFYKMTIPSGYKCDLIWTVTPDSNSDYDLYVKWTAGSCPSRSSYDASSTYSTGQVDTLSRTQLSSGAYYTLVYKYSGTGSYTMSASMSNCASVTPPPTPTLTFSANPTQVSSGSSSTLTWSSTNTTSCSASASPSNAQWSGSKVTSGSQTITNLTTSTTFALTCSGAGGSVTKNVVVSVSVPTPTLSPPTLISPLNGSLVPITPALDWTDVTGAVIYQWAIGTITGTTTVSQATITSGLLAYNTTYYWKVRACADTALQNCSPWSTEWSFKTPLAPTTKQITVISPNGGEVWVSGETRRISWSSVGVDYVQIYIYNPTISGSGSTNYIITSGAPISAAIAYYDWVIPSVSQLPGGGGSTYKIRIFDNSNPTIEDYSNNYFSIVAAGTTTPPTTCDSTSFTSYSTSYDFKSTGGTISNVCGTEQYYKITIPTGQTCDLKWTLQPDSNSDYDLYTRWDTGTLARTSYQERSINGKGLKDELSKTGLSAGTYYAMAYKETGTTGSYSITVSLTNCPAVTPPTAFDFSLSMNPSSGSVAQGSTLSPAPVATLTLTSGTTQPVSLTTSGQPSGTTITFSPDSSCSPTCNRTMNISTSSVTPTGTYSITITATGGGKTKTTNYTLTVTSVGVTPPTTDTQALITQLQAQINQILVQIAQLQAELARLKAGQPSIWCYNFKFNLRYKDTGDEVRALQTALQKEGIFKGTIDGSFGIETLEAVIAFQEKYSTEILAPWQLNRGTGFVGSTTIKKLNQLYGCK